MGGYPSSVGRGREGVGSGVSVCLSVCMSVCLCLLMGGCELVSWAYISVNCTDNESPKGETASRARAVCVCTLPTTRATTLSTHSSMARSHSSLCGWVDARCKLIMQCVDSGLVVCTIDGNLVDTRQLGVRGGMDLMCCVDSVTSVFLHDLLYRLQQRNEGCIVGGCVHVHCCYL